MRVCLVFTREVCSLTTFHPRRDPTTGGGDILPAPAVLASTRTSARLEYAQSTRKCILTIRYKPSVVIEMLCPRILCHFRPGPSRVRIRGWGGGCLPRYFLRHTRLCLKEDRPTRLRSYRHIDTAEIYSRSWGDLSSHLGVRWAGCPAQWCELLPASSLHHWTSASINHCYM